MGAKVSTFKRSSSTTQRLQQQGGGGGDGVNSSRPGPSYMELLKPECLKAEKKKMKRPLTPEKKKKNCTNHNVGIGGVAAGGGGTGTKLTTLEEWLLSSPGNGMNNISGGELHVFRHHSRRIHPAASSSSQIMPTHHHTAAQKAADEAANLANSNDISSTMSRASTQSSDHDGFHKLKKKQVSFRLPEEADIFIFDPSEELMMTDSDIDDEDDFE